MTKWFQYHFKICVLWFFGGANLESVRDPLLKPILKIYATVHCWNLWPMNEFLVSCHFRWLQFCMFNIKIRFRKILSLIVSRSSDSVVSYAIWRAVTNGSCELCYTREETKMWAWEEVCAAIPFKGSFFMYVKQILHIIWLLTYPWLILER